MPSAITLDELVDEFEFLGEWRDQCQYLIELGEELPELSEAERCEANLVRGCQSRVWFVPRVYETDGGVQQIEIRAKSDAKIVDGLIVVLLSMANRRRPQDILKLDFEGAFRRLGLEAHLVPQRRNGLHSMVQRLRAIAELCLGARPAEAALSAPGTTHSPAARPLQRAPARETPGGPLDAERLRREFPALQQRLDVPITFLDTAASAQKPQLVIDKQREAYEQYYANAYRGVYRFGDRVSRELEESRDKVRGFIGAEHLEEIVFTSGTTAAINMVAQGWGLRHLRAGDEILLSILEHHANYVPWQWVAQQTGAVLRWVPLREDGGWNWERLDEVLSERTRVFTIAGMTNVFGLVAPLERIVPQVKASGAMVVIDAAQSAPHLPLNVADLGIDFLAFSGHKLYGPSGVGVLYGRRERLAETSPLLYGGHMIERVERETFTLAPLPARFEAGTLPIGPAIALGAAVDWTLGVGLDRIHAHEMTLLAAAQERLQEIPGLTLHGPATDKGAILSFTMAGASAQDLATLLDLKGVCVRHGHHCAMPLHDWLGVPATVRASFGPYNTLEDIDTLVDALLFARQQLHLK